MKKTSSLASRVSKLERLAAGLKAGVRDVDAATLYEAHQVRDQAEKLYETVRERLAALEQTGVKTLVLRVGQLEHESQMLRSIVREAELKLAARQQQARVAAPARHAAPTPDDDLVQRVANVESALQYTISLQSRVNILMERVAALEKKP